ncbi:MAG TPA: hypothetical protein DCQ56_01410, partial [Porphyromonadaceae bacterium]|nr:hypothetical protein [Porphyromonadaceae bacterium]
VKAVYASGWSQVVTHEFDVEPWALVGDVNGDGEVSIADVTALVDLVMRDAANPRSDVNGDGETSVADVTTLVSLLMQ